MRRMSKTRTLSAAVLAAGALALGACGGGGTTPGGGGPGGVDTESSSYQGGYTFCSTGTLEQLAAAHSATEQTPEAVAEAVADAVGGNEEDRELARQGCLDAIEEQGIE